MYRSEENAKWRRPGERPEREFNHRLVRSNCDFKHKQDIGSDKPERSERVELMELEICRLTTDINPLNDRCQIFQAGRLYRQNIVWPPKVTQSFDGSAFLEVLNHAVAEMCIRYSTIRRVCYVRLCQRFS